MVCTTAVPEPTLIDIKKAQELYCHPFHASRLWYAHYSQNEQRRAYAIMYNTRYNNSIDKKPTKYHKVYEYTPVDIYRCFVFDCN